MGRARWQTEHLIEIRVVVPSSGHQKAPVLTHKISYVSHKLEEEPLFERREVRVGATPAGINNIRSVDGGVDDPRIPVADETIGLAGGIDEHQLCVPAGTGYPDTVVGHRRGHSGHRRTVFGIQRRTYQPGGIARVIGEVPAVHIINVAVAVIINTRLPIQLGGIGPDVGPEVLVPPVRAAIYHGNNHGWIGVLPFDHVPGGGRLDVRQVGHVLINWIVGYGRYSLSGPIRLCRRQAGDAMHVLRHGVLDIGIP
ncbi:hypothetical protein ES703_84878 [subsurface metagenome]